MFEKILEINILKLFNRLSAFENKTYPLYLMYITVKEDFVMNICFTKLNTMFVYF